MASKRSGSRAKSGGSRAGKRAAKKGSLKDLETKDGQKIRGGVTLKPIVITKPIVVASL